MWPKTLPPLPVALSGVDVCLAGTAARHALGGPRPHQAPELLVALDAKTLDALLGEAGAAGAVDGRTLEGWRVVPAPDGLADALAARLLPLDALGVRPGGEVLDPLGGRAAWREGRLSLRATDPEVRPAVLVRVLALASELDIAPDAAAIERLTGSAGHVLRADRDELRDAFTQLLVGRRVVEALQLAESTRLMAFALPEVAALVDFHRSSRFHHKDVWQHTCLVVRQSVPRAAVRWAALLHDVGKVHTRSYEAGRKVHFLRHDELGAYMCEGVAARLRFPAPLAERVRALVLHHLRANLFDPAWTDAAVRRFAGEVGPWLEDLLHLSRADVTSKRVGRRREAMYNLFALRQRIERLRAEDEARRPLVPSGLGTAIIEALAVAPGPRVGELRRACEGAVRDGLLPRDADVDTCLEFLRARTAAA